MKNLIIYQHLLWFCAKYAGLLDTISLYPLPKHKQRFRGPDSATAPKTVKIRSTKRHTYASVLMPEDDEEANRRNVAS